MTPEQIRHRLLQIQLALLGAIELIQDDNNSQAYELIASVISECGTLANEFDPMED